MSVSSRDIGLKSTQSSVGCGAQVCVIVGSAAAIAAATLIRVVTSASFPSVAGVADESLWCWICTKLLVSVVHVLQDHRHMSRTARAG